MAHLVPHHRLDLGQRGAAQQVVVQGDALGTEEAGDVGGHTGGLPRRVHLVHLARGDAVGARHREDRRRDAGVTELRVGVEEREDVHRRDQRDEHHEDDGDEAAPDPPGAPGAPQHRVDRHEEETSQHDPHQQALHPVAEPRPEILRGEVVGVLAHEALVDGEREGDHARDDQELHPVERGAQRGEAGEPLGEIAHPGRPPGDQQAQVHHDGRHEVPEQEPVAALEVGVGARLVGRRHGREPGVRGGERVEVIARLGPGGHGERRRGAGGVCGVTLRGGHGDETGEQQEREEHEAVVEIMKGERIAGRRLGGKRAAGPLRDRDGRSARPATSRLVFRMAPAVRRPALGAAHHLRWAEALPKRPLSVGTSTNGSVAMSSKGIRGTSTGL